MVELRTLGSLVLRTADGRELRRLLARPKCLAVLAVLALGGPRLRSRDTLFGLFWPECDQAHARLSLRQTLHVLRSELGPGTIVSRGALIGVVPERLWCDAAAFDAAYDQRRYEDALELYRGELLPGLYVPAAPDFERWLELERGRLQDRACWAAWELSEQWEQTGTGTHAAFWGRRAVSLCPHDEAGVRRLITLLHRTGDRVGALRAYDEFARRMAADYEMEPSPETRRLVEAIRANGTPRTAQARHVFTPSGSSPAAGPHALSPCEPE